MSSYAESIPQTYLQHGLNSLKILNHTGLDTFIIPPKFGYSFTTDGVSVSMSMNRIVSKRSKFKSKRVKKDEASIENSHAQSKSYSKIISVDPGAKTPIVTCTRSNDGGFEYRVLKKERVVYETKEHHREKKRSRFTKDIEDRVNADRENRELETGVVITFKSTNVREYTRFQLKWFDEKQRVYEQRRLQRLKFDKYINDQKMLNKIVDEYFGKEPDTLIVYGAGFDFLNKGTFKGHRKFRHNEVLKIIRQRKNLSVFIINEAFTTKNCSKCYESGLKNHLHVSKSPHRYVYCSVCRKGIHRDKNGAKNILLKFEKNKNLPICLSSIGTDMNFVDGGSS